MPQKSIQDEPGGIATPKLTQDQAQVNTAWDQSAIALTLAGAMESDGLVWLEAGCSAFLQMEAIFKAIAAGTSRQDRAIDVFTLAELGKSVAADYGNELDASRERMEAAISESRRQLPGGAA